MFAGLAERRPEIAELCKRFGVQRLDAFGSASTGSFRPGRSDLDFLVDFANPEANYADRYFGLKESLEALFGCDVDLVSAEISNPFFRESVERTKTLLYAA